MKRMLGGRLEALLIPTEGETQMDENAERDTAVPADDEPGSALKRAADQGRLPGIPDREDEVEAMGDSAEEPTADGSTRAEAE